MPLGNQSHVHVAGHRFGHLEGTRRMAAVLAQRAPGLYMPLLVLSPHRPAPQPVVHAFVSSSAKHPSSLCNCDNDKMQGVRRPACMDTEYAMTALKRRRPLRWVPSQLPCAPPARPLHPFQERLSWMRHLRTREKIL